MCGEPGANQWSDDGAAKIHDLYFCEDFLVEFFGTFVFQQVIDPGIECS